MARRLPLLNVLLPQFPELTRDSLYRAVMCGEIRDESGAVYTDPQEPVPPDRRFVLARERYVSRGGEKLDAALQAWKIDAAGMCWLDAGASTGGFTDCLLQRGARSVHTVDVGYNQLDFRLRRDPRVFVRERTNIQAVDALDPVPDAAVCDLSFRSLRGIIHHILDLTSSGWGIALLKPQFEGAAEVRWGRRDEQDLNTGVISGETRDEIVAGVIRALEREEGLRVERRLTSPIPGRRGNREELLLLRLYS